MGIQKSVTVFCAALKRFEIKESKYYIQLVMGRVYTSFKVGHFNHFWQKVGIEIFLNFSLKDLVLGFGLIKNNEL